jgi:hypothetical protein
MDIIICFFVAGFILFKTSSFAKETVKYDGKKKLQKMI